MDLNEDNKRYLLIGMCIGVVITIIFLAFSLPYSSEAECKVKELQKGAATDTYYRNSVRTYCREQYRD